MISPMAALSRFPTCGSLRTSQKYLSYPQDHSFKTLIPNHKNLYPTIYASSTKKTRANRKVKSNTELCNDIREFISMVGLAEGNVPSLKELSQHGRQDLANIVRRRGYKLIKQLLATSIESDENEPDKKEGSTEQHDADDTGQYESIGQGQKLEDKTEDLLVFDKVPVDQNHTESANGENMWTSFDFGGWSNIALESQLQDRVAKFIKSGELDSFNDDDGFDILHVISADVGNVDNKSEELPIDLRFNGKEGFKQASGKMLNGSMSKSKQIILHENDSPSDVYLQEMELSTAACVEETDLEIGTRENETEVNRLKFILNLKELELSQLKEQIEKEKLALSLLHTEAEKEISKAHKIVSEKDTELLAAEEILSDLKEVQVQYVGDGETVQVAGSFNGWHHQITMDPQPSSSILDPNKLRNSRLWSTVLWLYPGTYEIKFVIDGHWRIDPQRDAVTMGTIQNNILRVDR